MGISRDSRHKRSATSAQRASYRKKRKFELGRQPANTRIGTKRIHEVRVRGGNKKLRALRLDSGNFSWPSEGVAKKTRIIATSYHPSNNELVRTNTLTKSAIVQIDATPFRNFYESFYGGTIGKSKRARQQAGATDPTKATTAEGEGEVKKSKKLERKLASRQAARKLEPALESQFANGRLYAVIASRPGQSGRADGYVLEGEELAFYLRKMQSKK